jgi:putative ABC transport system permease protein
MFTDSLDPRVQSGSLAGFARGEAMVNKAFAEDNDLALGDTITVANPLVPGTEQDLVIGVIIDSRAVDSPVVVPPGAYDSLVPDEARQAASAFIQMAPGADLEDVRAGLTDAVKPYYIVSVFDQDQFASNLADMVNQILTILYALLALSIVVAVIGIINTLALSVMERTREIGMMRAVGLGKLQLAGTITIESILIAVFGAVAGLAVGVGLASAMPTVFADQGITALVIPWGSLAVMLGLAAIVGVLAALWPAVRAARLPVLESVTYD